MNDDKKKSIGVVHDSNHLRQLIKENPDLPIVVLVGEEAATDEFAYTYCTRVSATVGNVLDCETTFRDCYVFNDRDDFREAVQLYLEDIPEYESLSDSEFDELINKTIAEYEPYWKRCIIVTADN